MISVTVHGFCSGTEHQANLSVMSATEVSRSASFSDDRIRDENQSSSIVARSQSFMMHAGTAHQRSDVQLVIASDTSIL